MDWRRYNDSWIAVSHHRRVAGVRRRLVGFKQARRLNLRDRLPFLLSGVAGVREPVALWGAVVSRDVDTDLAADVVIIPVPPGFKNEEALRQLARLVVSLLEHGMPEREIAKRLMRYHPAQEGV